MLDTSVAGDTGRPGNDVAGGRGGAADQRVVGANEADRTHHIADIVRAGGIQSDDVALNLNSVGAAELDAVGLVAGDEIACARGGSTYYGIAGCYGDSSAVADGSRPGRIGSDVVAHDHGRWVLDFDSRAVPRDDISRCRISSSDCRLGSADSNPDADLVFPRRDAVRSYSNEIALNYVATGVLS